MIPIFIEGETFPDSMKSAIGLTCSAGQTLSLLVKRSHIVHSSFFTNSSWYGTSSETGCSKNGATVICGPGSISVAVMGTVTSMDMKEGSKAFILQIEDWSWSRGYRSERRADTSLNARRHKEMGDIPVVS